MTHPSVLHLFLGDGDYLRHLCFSVPAHPPLRYVCTGLRRQRLPDAWDYGSLYPCIPLHKLRSAAYVRGYGDSVFQTHGDMVSLSSHPSHILRSAAYVRGYRDSVFQTHWIMGLSILASPAHPPLRCVCTGLQRQRLPDAWDYGSLNPRIPRTSSAPLRMYGGTEIASSRRMGPWVSLSLHPPHILRSAAYVRGQRDSVFQTHGGMGLSILASPAHTPLRCVCTGLQRQRLPDAQDRSTLYPNSLFRIPHL